jgi:hypothetical protein
VGNVWSAVTIDCVDPQRVARFWRALLGRQAGPSEAGWVASDHPLERFVDGVDLRRVGGTFDILRDPSTTGSRPWVLGLSRAW